MIIQIHPSAASNFNKKANELFELIEVLPMLKEMENSFPSEEYVSDSINGNDIIGEIDVATSDYRGMTIQRYFFHNDQMLGLSEANYKSLHEIAERIQSLSSIRSMLSCSFIEKKLFSWIAMKYKDLDSPDLFIEYLNDEAQGIVKRTTSWIPIANLEVQCSFTVSHSEIRPLSKAVIDKWAVKIEALSGENKKNALMLFDRIRKDYQGLAAVVTTITSEPEYASHFALEEAQQITAILGIFSIATLIPDIKCVSKIKGFENIEQFTVFFENDENNFETSTRIIDPTSVRQWRLNQSEIEEIRRIGLDVISALLVSDSQNDFEKSVLNAVFLYSKAAFTADPIEKIVHMLSSLESILLKNENEPIQQNLAERIAVFTSQDLVKRKSIIRLIKSVYVVRSKYLHHGHTSSELELVSRFMLQVRLFFMQLLANVNRFSTQLEFINAIDDHKLS